MSRRLNKESANPRLSLLQTSILISLSVVVVGFALIWLGYSEYSLVLMVAAQPVIVAILWRKGRLISKLNEEYLKNAEIANSRIIGDISRMREEILDAIDETK